MLSRSCLTQFDPTYETLDELPAVNMEQIGRYVYIPDDDTFYVLNYGGWLPLGIKFPVTCNQIRIKLSDDVIVVNSETIPCWSEDYMSNVQMVVYDFGLDLKKLAKVEYSNDAIINNHHFDIFGINLVSSNSIPFKIPIDNDIELSKSVTNVLNVIHNTTDVLLYLTEDNKSGLYLGDPCFRVSESLLLNEAHLSNFGADDLSQMYFDYKSNTQFVIDNLGSKIHDYNLLNITGTPQEYPKLTYIANTTSAYDAVRIGDNLLDLQDVYDNWIRWAPPDKDADLWTFVDGSIHSTVNSVYPLFFHSAAKYSKYSFELTVRSGNMDDDFIFLVAAKSDTSNICIVRSKGASGWLAGAGTFFIMYNFGLPGQILLANSNNVEASGGGWGGDFSRIFVNRYERLLTVACSPFNSEEIDPATQLTIDLGNYPELINEQHIGFGAYSQADSWFSAPDLYEVEPPMKSISSYIRGNGVDWSTFNPVSSDEIYAPLAKCVSDDCKCVDPTTITTSLQQSVAQLYKYKSTCTNYLLFEHFVDTDEDLVIMTPFNDPDDTETPDVVIVERIVYDTRSDEVWVFNCGEWIIDDCKSVCDLELNKMYFNTITRKLFYIACDCSVYCLMGFPFVQNPCE